MKYILAGLKIISPFALLVAGFCSCASTEVQKSSAKKSVRRGIAISSIIPIRFGVRTDSQRL